MAQFTETKEMKKKSIEKKKGECHVNRRSVSVSMVIGMGKERASSMSSPKKAPFSMRGRLVHTVSVFGIHFCDQLHLL